MAVTRTLSQVDILDRVLDKGIVVDGWLTVSVAGLDLIGLEGRMVVASLSTYLKHAKMIDRALGRAIPARARATSPRAAAPPPVPVASLPAGLPPCCPRCEKHGRRQDVVLVTVQTNAEMRVTARCSVCRWQHTRAL